MKIIENKKVKGQGKEVEEEKVREFQINFIIVRPQSEGPDPQEGEKEVEATRAPLADTAAIHHRVGMSTGDKNYIETRKY